MGTTIRPELSENNKYWIDRHRYYELKHFCLQYLTWKRTLQTMDGLNRTSRDLNYHIGSNTHTDPTSKEAEARMFYTERIKMVERLVEETDSELASYILKGVTEAASYEYLKNSLDMPCSRDTYYDRYRKFFWLLDKTRK